LLKFKTIRWKNLLSTGNYFTEVDLDNQQNTLIVGENGSGKSTLLDALCFVLFGKAFRNINKPNLINSINNKDCIVEIEFETNSKKYRVLRGIKPVVFEIYQNGELLNKEASSRDYQEILEKSILKLNFKSFTQIVILGSASFVPFMQLSAADRRTIIEDLLDIQIFSMMNNIVKDRLSNNKDLTVEKKNEIEISQQKYDMLKKHIDEMISDNEEKILKLNEEIETNNIAIENFNNDNKDLLNSVNVYQKELEQKTVVEGKIKKLSKLESQIETNLSKYRKDVLFFGHNDNCPTCRQTIDSSFKENELVCLHNKIGESESGLKKLEDLITEEQNRLNEIIVVQKIIQELQIKTAKNNTTIIETKKYIEKIKKQIEELKVNKLGNENQNAELSTLNNSIIGKREELKQLIENKNYYEVASGLLKDTGIKTKIVRQYLPIINKLVNKYLTSLDFFVNFNLDESFKETIKSRHRDDFTYNNFSEGEKQRIDMALMLTWRAVAKLKNSSNTNLLILDEIFDSSLDSNGTEELMKILHLLEGVNLFVISHKGDILQDKFANVLRFKKIKNFSRLVK
jgi:DNA repair exonuclease SbcCD ATPase subunit